MCPRECVRVLRMCLQKDPRQRAQAIGDVRLALEGAFETTAPQTTAPARASASRGRVVTVAVAAGVILALAIPAALYFRRAAPERRVIRLELTTPPTADLVSMA